MGGTISAKPETDLGSPLGSLGGHIAQATQQAWSRFSQHEAAEGKAATLQTLDRSQLRAPSQAGSASHLVPLANVFAPARPQTNGPAMAIAEFDRWADAHTTTRATDGNSVDVLIDGDAYFNALEREIRGARRSVAVVTHTFSDSEMPTRVVDAMIDRARAGVPVTFITDWFGTTREGEPRNMQRLRDAGVHVGVVDDKVLATRLFETTHSKITIVDGEVGFVGGHNLSGGGYEKHDVTLRVRGPVLQDVQDHFARIWREASGGQPLQAVPVNTARAGNVRLRSMETRHDNHDFRAAALHAIDSARNYINAEQAYLTDFEFAQHLMAAARRGVRVNVTVPERTDEAMVQDVHNANMWRWMGAGIQFYRYPRPMHTKALSVDGAWATIGSTNFTNRGTGVNFEMSLGISDPALVAQLDRNLFAQDRSISRRMDLDHALDQRGGLWDQTVNYFKTRFVRPHI